MEYLSKVTLSPKVYRQYLIKISLVGSVSLLGIALAIVSLTMSAYLFAFWYIIAAILGLSYVVIRINAVFPLFLATDGEKVVLSVWENGVVPYKLPEKPNIFTDFIPDKVKKYEIAMDDIEAVIIGSKKFLIRNLDEENHPEIFKRFEKDKHFENIVRRMDFIYIKTKDQKGMFMPVTDFDTEEIAKFLGVVEKYCQGVQILTNLPKLVRIRKSII